MSYIGTQPVPQSLQSRQQFTGDGSTTIFATIGGVELYEDVFLNGVRLSRVDNEYSFDGTTLTITPAPANGDTVSIILRNDHSELIALPITDSQGNNVLSESSGTVTLTADEANVGSNALVVDSSGKVGVGTSSPATKLNLGGSADQSIQINGSGTAAFVGTSTSIAQLSSNRNPTTGAIYDSGRAAAYINLQSESGDSSIQFYTTTVNNTNPTERMRIGSSGNVNINNLSASSDVQTDASKNLITTSDARLKNEIGLIDESGIGVIKQIIPKYFSWKNDENNNQQLGFFAQDIYPVLPEAAPRALKYTEVGRDENDEPILEQVFDENGNPDYEWGFTDRPIIAMCVKAIQEQQVIIESQQSQIDALTARIVDLETT